MSMDTQERHLLKRLHTLIASIPKDAPDADWCIAMTANASVLKNVLNAQEPFYKASACLSTANQQLSELDHFVTHRQSENWQPAALSRN